MPFPSARFLSWLLLAALAVGPVQAATDLVTGAAPVADRSNAARAAALPAVLADALRRLTPDADPAANPDVAARLAESDQTMWLQRFEYQQRIRPTASGVPSIRLMLHGWFHAAPLRELLLDAGVPVWRGGGVDPLFWFLADPGNGVDAGVDTGADAAARIAAATADRDDAQADPPPATATGTGADPARGALLLDADAVGASALAEALAGHGITPHWAMNDLEDWRMAGTLTPGNVADGLAAAAARYGTSVPVLVWFHEQPPQVVARWHLLANAGVDTFESRGSDRTAALTAGSGDLLAALARTHTVRAGTPAPGVAAHERGPGDYSIWLAGLSRSGSYANALAVLSAQSPVVSVAPEQASGDRVRVRVHIDQPLSRLLALLEVDGRLRLEEAAPEPAGGATADAEAGPSGPGSHAAGAHGTDASDTTGADADADAGAGAGGTETTPAAGDGLVLRWQE